VVRGVRIGRGLETSSRLHIYFIYVVMQKSD